MRASLRLLLAGAVGAMVGGAIIAWLQHPPAGSSTDPAQRRHGVPRVSAEPRLPDLNSAFPALPELSREFRTLDAAGRSTLQTLTQELWQATDDAERWLILDRLEGECYSVELIALVRSALESPGWGEAARLRAVELLAGNLDPAIVSALELARRAPEENLRAASLMAAARVVSGFSDFALPALGDASAVVRLTVLEAVVEQSDNVQTRLRAAALQGRHADVARRALGDLQVDASAANLPALFSGLDAPLAEVRDETRLALEFLLDQTFSNAAAAAAWWAANRHRYDAELILKAP